jgi:raffinose/stachyose/melibiose transport system permease protein
MTKTRVVNAVVFLLLAFAALFTLFPLMMAFLNSFKTNRELLTSIMSWPATFSIENYVRTFASMHYLRSLANTITIAGAGVLMMIFFSALAGWKICRTPTRLSRVLLGLFIFSMLVPFSSIMIPLYRISLLLGIKNKLLGLSLIYAGLGVSMAIFLYHGFVKGIPAELEEAAEIDGCGEMRKFVAIILPLLKPITATVCITNVLWMWNDFLLPLIIISDNKKYTLLLSTNTLFGQYSNDWTGILSALVMAALPVIIFYGFFQKWILKGISEGALKG